MATKNIRETKPESWTSSGEAENGAMTWLGKRLELNAKAQKFLVWFCFKNNRLAVELWVEEVGKSRFIVP